MTKAELDRLALLEAQVSSLESGRGYYVAFLSKTMADHAEKHDQYTPTELQKADKIFRAAESNYETWGHWIVESRDIEDCLELETIAEAKELGTLLNERESDSQAW
jgi:hypothetical protein